MEGERREKRLATSTHLYAAGLQRRSSAGADRRVPAPLEPSAKPGGARGRMSGGGSSGNRRKLDAVYSALSEHNLPQAIKLSLRKDICNWDETKALRAHALQRLLRVDEALQLAREVASKTPTDVLVLEPLKNVFINSVRTPLTPHR
eukprot:scaffold2036_cov256-Pinguiococcus_pyrenoidosus.AAC.5